MAVNIKSPISYFFTDPTAFSQVADDAFRPIDENNFQVTTTFSQALKAYAVTDGILLIGLQEPISGEPPRINIILRPSTDIGIGIKIKYFVYRGIDATELFKNLSGTVLLDESSTLTFIQKALDAFQEFNQTNADLEASKIGLIEVNTTVGITNDILKRYFNKGSYNLLKVVAGTPLGKFLANFGGFEIVLDDGDYVQEKSDTGLYFNENFVRSRKSILKADGNHADTAIFGGNSSGISAKIFRENIYRFLDPAAFYGAHVTSQNNTNNGGSIKVVNVTNPYQSSQDIYDHVVSKFINKNKVYIYIKGNRGRSYKFYKADNDRVFYESNDVAQTPSSSWTPTSFLTDSWPIKIRISFDEKYGISLGYFNENTAFSNFVLNEVRISNNDKRIIRNDILFKNLINFKTKLPRISGVNISSILYITFLYKETAENEGELDHIFGNINLKSIFEIEDISGEQGSYVSHVRDVLIRDGNKVGLYNTKVVLEGKIISSYYPSTTTTFGDDDLRTYLLQPIIISEPKDNNTDKATNAGNYIIKNKTDYLSKIYGGGKIWEGVISDGVSIKSLLYRKKDNDVDLPVYHLGITQNEYYTLESNVKTIDANATNLFFVFEEVGITSPAFIKYKVHIKFDKANGEIGISTAFIYLYSIDGYYFFTKNYSNKFLYCENDFAKIAVDFLPNALNSALTGYTLGFDFVGHEIDSAVPTSTLNRNRYTDLVGKYDISDNFIVSKRRFLNLNYSKYNSKPTSWRTGANDFPFHTDSFITLYPNKEAVVKIKFSRKSLADVPTELYMSYNKNLISISDSNSGKFVIPKTKYNQNSPSSDFTIKVKCLQTFDKNQSIDVIAVEKDGKSRIAGRCWIRKNNKRYKLDVVLINCITDIDGAGSIPERKGLTSGLVPLVKEIIQNFMIQILIMPQFELKDTGNNIPFDLDLKNNTKFIKGTSGSFINSNNKIVVNNDVFIECKSKFEAENNAQTNKTLLFFFAEEAVSAGSGENINGQAYIKDETMGGAYGASIFTSTAGVIDPKNTIAHELLHSLGLYHSFDNGSEFTFEKLKTDNIMDYSTDNMRKLVWYWQDETVKMTSNNNKLKSE